MPNLHLFSTGDEKHLDAIIEACRLYLKGMSDASIAYLPQASLNIGRWLELTRDLFKGLARLDTIDTEQMTLPEMDALLRRAGLVLIPGGNPYLLSHRLHISGLMPSLRRKVQGGLPVVAASAGTIFCGPNILTTRDLNAVATPHFEGLHASPFNFRPHYPADPYQQSVLDDWLSDYHVFNDNPVILLSDGASVKMDGRKTSLVRGEAWILRKGQDKDKLEEGRSIAV